MLTTNHFAVSWLYREGDRSIRRTAYHDTAESCIEAARFISGNPCVFEVEVQNVDTAKAVVWEPTQVGQVLFPADAPAVAA